MFERESKLNLFLLEGFQRIVSDIPADQIAQPPMGKGHPPLWVIGHLAICAELGLQILGNPLSHPEWMQTFGPGSNDRVANPEQYSKDELVQLVINGYADLRRSIADIPPNSLSKPHGLALLEGTPIETFEDLMAHLLSTHFAFHLAQLSAWRRDAGHGPLF